MLRTAFISCFLAFAGLAFGQSANIPPCNSSTATTGVSTNCTDYFGVANYANSPLPTGSSIASIAVSAPGAGYVNPTVVISDPVGTGAFATAAIDSSGTITSISVTVPGSGYIAPIATIVDNGATSGTGALLSVTLTGGTGGIRKFVDNLATLPMAVPDTITFPGSDYYVIALQQYQQKMHSDLPPTTLRGYVQLNNGTDANGQNTVGPHAISYLGPLLVAQRNRPVRILFRNMLDPGKQLFIPVDTTYMGADASYSQQRATLHLHGGNTPWISDGTPHQWTVPEGDATTTHARGVSTQFVPDMFFDANHNQVPVPACSASITTACYPNAVPAGLTNDPGPGRMTFYWTNQQGGRLLFFHDHAYGLTRLNVYVGEAAGYLIYDPNEEKTLASATVPGTIGATADLAHLIPLVIQDKTFVPPLPQLQAEDPTWIGNFGSSPTSGAVEGDLWYPHVYMPNQNPGDAENTNAFGRWDYGAWFWPPQNPATFVTDGQPKACTSAAYLDLTTGSPIAMTCPGTPNPSGTPESFMDTPVINGTAYPVLHVAPSAYRFQILNAANDRTWNLQLYVADSTGKEVKMVPAVPGTNTCTVPINQPSLGVGLASAVLDAGGNPVNGTGIPASCWPSTWPTDGRDGGVPDPAAAGPPIIQIGNESGLLPAPVVIPATPVNFEYGRRSVTVLNVSTHGLMMGPAERADAIIDFSAFAGKTLILYNDAPAPIPAFDSRFDYYTGDVDETSMGGAPTTQPGYGPNTRTLMQIVVDGTGSNVTPFSLPALTAAFKSTASTPGAFAQLQNPIIVPEPTYNSAYNTTLSTNTYSKVQDTQFTFTPIGATSAQTVPFKAKAIQELFTLDYGRMNATLGTELPLTNFLTQTTIPLSYIDPATELVHPNEIQLWRITHNGVDTHFIHFHLFDVQVINRVGWDGTIRPPDGNELGWKDTVRMNPLEDIVVALKPLGQSGLPWPVPDSIRLMDTTATTGTSTQFTNVDPFSNLPATTFNALQNFGWEYVWHCHILGHEENDMMRPIVFQVPPPAPPALTAALNAKVVGQVDLKWQDASASESSFAIERATDANFTLNHVVLKSAPASKPSTAWGGTMTATDKPGVGTFYYRVQAVDDNFSVASGLAQAYNAQPATVSTWTTAQINTAQPIIAVSPLTLNFGGQVINTTSTALSVTVRNTGSAPLTLTSTIAGTNASEFVLTASNCAAAGVAANTSCTISLTFKPTVLGARSASLVITSNDVTNPSITVPLSGTGALASSLTLTPSALTFTQAVGGTSAAQTITVRNTGTTNATNLAITITGANRTNFARTTTCGNTLQAGRTCTVSVTFSPTAAGTATATLQVTPGTGAAATANLTGTGTAGIATVSPTSLGFGSQRRLTSSSKTVTLSNTGTAPLVINSISITPPFLSSFTQSNNCPTGFRSSLGIGASCTITVNFMPLTTGAKTATLNVNVAAPASSVTVALTGTGQ